MIDSADGQQYFQNGSVLHAGNSGAFSETGWYMFFFVPLMFEAVA